MVRLGIEDMRKNPWLIDHMLGDLTENPYLANLYGKKHVQACKDWFLANEIELSMVLRKDHDRFPCITFNVGTSPEKDEMKTMGDLSTYTYKLMPNEIGKPIAYIAKPFTGFSYDSLSGELTLPIPALEQDNIAAGMIVVDPDTGTGYVIREVIPEGVLIEDGLTITATRLGIVPQYQFYWARVEHTFFQETYQIKCHAHGDPQVLLWLHSIVLYSILRYRESLLEANGFTQSSVSSGDMYINPYFDGGGGESVYSRDISLTGMVENSWLKSPKRVIEVINLKDPESTTGYTGGIKILSNLDTDMFEQTNWVTIESDSEG